MKPVRKGKSPYEFSEYQNAKPHLIAAIGQHCSYCEAWKDPQSLHVEHIYPKSSYPRREVDWDNFLVSCVTCNSYKHIYLRDNPCDKLEERFLWPHLDNTYLAFNYHEDGRVEVNSTVSAEVQAMASATCEMTGVMKSPAVAEKYKELGIAYDGVDKRREAWGLALFFYKMYRAAPDKKFMLESISQHASMHGHFSIWMKVFEDYSEVRKVLVSAFKADVDCFDENVCPVRKGRV
jgi:uncharacterized protein (TIGR02646 family)